MIERNDKEPVTDIFSLLQKVLKTGYTISFRPDVFYQGTVRIQLSDPGTSKNTAILMRVDKRYVSDPNRVIFDYIDAVIKDMEEESTK